MVNLTSSSSFSAAPTTAIVVDSLSKTVADVSALPDSRGPLRRLCCDLARRVRLLGPLFDELRDVADLGDVDVRELSNLHSALVAAKDLLRDVYDGSRLYQALKSEKFVEEFDRVTQDIEQALSKISYEKFDIAEEVKEQTELVHGQLRRAKDNIDIADLLLVDIKRALTESDRDPAMLKRISEKLQLKTMADMKRESVALHEMVISSDGEPDGVEEMSSLLKMLTSCVLEDNPASASIEKKSNFQFRSPVIPEDFRCPLSLELMKDPVIVSSGQTYERSSIQKWLDSGHKNCPKTQQHLSHTTLTPNFVLKSLIEQWCETNGIELHKKQGSYGDRKSENSSDCDRVGINLLLKKLQNGNQEEQRSAAGELRLLAKRNADNRICIAQAGAIPLLVQLLSAADPRTQEHAVTALLNLSINDGNKGIIVKANAIPHIVEVLESGSMEARENAAATLFSLSVVDQNKISIGEAGAIPALISLLWQGSPRGKKDAATAIFNLCIYQGNKVKAVKAGIVIHLMKLLVDPSGDMVDEALAILAILAINQDARTAIAQSNPISILVELLRTGSPRNRENATAVLCSLCASDGQQLKIVKEMGAEEALKELTETGTDRAKRKAGHLLDLIRQSADFAAVDAALS